jgi:hypothetical protein
MYTLMMAFAVCDLANEALAASYSFSGGYGNLGGFTQDDEARFFSFVADGTSAVTLETVSYAGGTLVDGTPVTAGGFDPLLTLLQPSGLVISTIPLNAGDTFSKPYVAGTGWDDKDPGVLLDSYYQGILDPGTYWLVLTQSFNLVNGANNNYYSTATGFIQQGDYTGALNGCLPATDPFCNFLGENKNGDWALNITGVVSAQAESTFDPPPPPPLPVRPDNTVAEPPTLALLGLGFAFMRWNRVRLGKLAGRV